MAVALQRAGIHDFVIVERSHDVGGVWRDNRYPGCACDVPSRMYSFSFEQKPDWSRDFATAGEIWGYLRDVADRYAVRQRIAFGADLRVARFIGSPRINTLPAEADADGVDPAYRPTPACVKPPAEDDELLDVPRTDAEPLRREGVEPLLALSGF